MKYIITKDGIYRNASVSTDLVIICRDRECEVNPSDIINQADTIEELCDEYRYGEHKLCYMYDKNVWLDWETDNELTEEEIATVKAAIWTDKGLIFIAKMKGILPDGEIEWELV